MTDTIESRTDELRLRNDLRVSLRPVDADDESAILQFLSHLSAESRRRRFFTVAVDLRAETHRELAVPPADQHGLLAWTADRGVVGHAIYVRAPQATRAEVAVEAADDLHHLGLATPVVIRLAQDAEGRHITRFFANVPSRERGHGGGGP
jgi:hypothetical protein